MEGPFSKFSSSLGLSHYATTLDSEAMVQYIKKISVLGGNDPYITLKNGRSLVEMSASELPDIAYHDIYTYLIASKSKQFTATCLKAYKSLEAYKYFIGGHVQNAIITSAATPCIKIITAEVRHSPKVSQPPLLPWIGVQDDGRILSTHCNCLVALGEVCCHIPALLFTLEEAVKIARGTTCTSLPSSWSCGPSELVGYSPRFNIEFISPVIRKECQGDHPYGHRHCPYIPPASDVKTKQLFLDLTRVYPKSAMLAGRPEYSQAALHTGTPDQAKCSLSLVCCYCEKKEEGTIVLCGHSSCKIKKFHLKCLGLKRRPKNGWSCIDCRKTPCKENLSPS